MIKAVLFDFIGTTVIEENNEVINHCFKKAFSDNDVNTDISVLKSNRGKNEKVIIENVLSSQKLSLSLIEAIYTSFKKKIIAHISKFCENEGTTEIISYLREQNIKVCIGSGLERDVF